MTQFSPRSLLLKTEVQGFYLRFPFQLATPPGVHATHIPKGNLVMYTKYHIYTVTRKKGTHSSAHPTQQRSAVRCCAVLCFFFRAHQKCMCVQIIRACNVGAVFLKLGALPICKSPLQLNVYTIHLLRPIFPCERAKRLVRR